MLVRLNYTIASQHGVVAHHRYERARIAERNQPLQKMMAAVCTHFERAMHLVVRKRRGFLGPWEIKYRAARVAINLY
jgi:hypothetical protein